MSRDWLSSIQWSQVADMFSEKPVPMQAKGSLHHLQSKPQLILNRAITEHMNRKKDNLHYTKKYMMEQVT